ncbi:MAG: hypothetical protein A3G32_09185 [Deltaproteobacteria bacterium RIFCSPLOWO2_12_FULL_40_28]|nr:MAG: hypothetical protein A3C45_08040 [Deltaproteobacteria bacterium RIFCSPHIGHO2_02_FULL_40_28]OGQ21194.1 MAG: hypothetical protein A3E27_01675 [Deltaproteobacteria bacterium RIFCSPHIGHO2_12_FULL_40_32]OGQ39095.1 MAG: hypothetical protein A3I69_09310 [Deltaproteobacteria bacterium RIFCSPLOWO2_02_FULL_40_36]OGQ53168.1 MAG: hypothetical protein A3G32_09185 [Deltaproteobacteria bacterium RIFCSPLOWO2_12_FULL_40_28]
MSGEFLDFGSSFKNVFQQNSLEQHLGTTVFWHTMLLDQDRSPDQLKIEEARVFNPDLDWDVLKASYDQLIVKATQDQLAPSDVSGFLKILHPTLPQTMINQMLQPAPAFKMQERDTTFTATPNYVGAAILARSLDGDEAGFEARALQVAEADFYQHLNISDGAITPHEVSTFYVQGNSGDHMVALAFWTAASVSYRMVDSGLIPTP